MDYGFSDQVIKPADMGECDYVAVGAYDGSIKHIVLRYQASLPAERLIRSLQSGSERESASGAALKASVDFIYKVDLLPRELSI